MKATGVVRRIDDLGRVVIPKEIRKTLRIKEGDPLEIFTDKEGEVILKKYSPIGELSEFASGYAETLAKTTGHIACITDKDTIIAVSGGSKKEYLEQNISEELEKIMDYKNATFSFDLNGYHFIILTTDIREDLGGNDGGIYKAQCMSEKEINWLKGDLVKNNLPCVIFTHFGLAEDKQIGNYWFEKI